jgi:hypothetical protein
LQAVARQATSEEQDAGFHAMPEASEEEWQHRAETRQRAILAGKDTPEYQWYSELKRGERREEGDPLTPDPLDRTVSRRHWKYAAQQWRIMLKQRYLEEMPAAESVISTEEWQSTSGAAATEVSSTTDGDVASSV